MLDNEGFNRCLLKDRFKLRKRWQKLQQLGLQKSESWNELCQQVVRSQKQAFSRAEHLLDFNFNNSLPVSAQRQKITELIKNNSVVVIAGETGSGKTTQLPKICLQAGRGVYGIIGHTQPRRLAARSVASRIAQELQVPLGETVGFQIRFTDQVSESTQVKLMTDGILLAEIQRDRFLNQYDTLIIDEAHERSLNIDFLLGYLKQLLHQRRDLKLIITSATIDLDRFSKHFNDAPVFHVSGRTYPVEVRYRCPLEQSENSDEGAVNQSILMALKEIEMLEKKGEKPPLGDVLIFQNGEREIRETALFLRKANFAHAHILPLYARLSAREQQRIFENSSGRKIILATNIAETSLTVPGVYYVIDPGTARVSRYSPRSKIQRLPVEPISQAAANQRKGRCGRVAPGICFRLYDEDDFLNRPEFTDPEIKRTNLASVILQMLTLNLGEVRAFPFMDSPSERAFQDGFQLLSELGAVDAEQKVTAVGRKMARFATDPRIARMIVAAAQEQALNEVLVIASALSIQDPRERPADKQQTSDQSHQKFQNKQSDFLSYLSLWQWYELQRQSLTQSTLRTLCKGHFLNFMRMREWRDMHYQLLQIARKAGYFINTTAASFDAIHRSLLSGLLGNVGFKQEEGHFSGTRQKKFWVFPGSALFKTRARWLMSFEQVETSKLYSRVNAEIKPEWIEHLGCSLLKHRYFDPYWSKKRGAVLAYEQLTLYGLIVVPKRRINYGPVAPAEARDIMIREGLAASEFETRAAFYQHNQTLIAEIEALEARSRRRDILVDDTVLFSFYDERIPLDVYDRVSLEKWCKQAPKDQVALLFMTQTSLMQHGASNVTDEAYPGNLTLAGFVFSLSYQFSPSDEDDGVTITVPAALFLKLPINRLQWLVPGMLEEKVIALLRTLPKAQRKECAPVPDTARQLLQTLVICDEPLIDILSVQLRRLLDVQIEQSHWQLDSLSKHFLMNIRVVDENGKLLAKGRDYQVLKSQLGKQVTACAFVANQQGLKDQKNILSWSFGELLPERTMTKGGISVTVYPALVDCYNAVTLTHFDNKAKSIDKTGWGLCRLIQKALPEQVKYLERLIKPLSDQICLQMLNVFNKPKLIDDITLLTIRQTFLKDGGWPQNCNDFKQLLESKRSDLMPSAESVTVLLKNIFVGYGRVNKQLKGKISPQMMYTLSDVKQQLSFLITRDFLMNTPYIWLEHFPRFLKAIEMRLERVVGQVAKDRAQAEEVQSLFRKWTERKTLLNERSVFDEHLQLYRWMLEEYRVSLFAQQLKTSHPVSLKRLETLWQKISKG